MLIYSDRHFRDDPLTAVAQFPRARGGQDPAARTRRQIGAGEGGDEVRVGMGAGNDGVLHLAPFSRNLKREKLTSSDLLQYTSFNAFYNILS